MKLFKINILAILMVSIIVLSACSDNGMKLNSDIRIEEKDKIATFYRDM